MDKKQKNAYLLLGLGIILFTISFLITLVENNVFSNIAIAGILTGNEIILEILYYGFNFGAFVCIIAGIFLLIKYKESVSHDQKL